MSGRRAPFELLGELPSGRLAVEASAGTGKTFTLAALATRAVAEQGLAASELLIVTFTRAATTELRARVRDRLVQAAAHLAAPDAVSDDPLLVHLAATDREVRLGHLQRAVTDFDAATITTIHGFATQVLATLGAAAGTDPDMTLVDDAEDLSRQAAADVLARAALTGSPAEHLPGLTPLTDVTRVCLGQPDLLLTPEPDAPGAGPAHHLLRQLTEEAVAAVGHHRRRVGARSFDDLLTDLRTALTGPGREAALAAVRGRYRLALIDEFQDTDPVQWTIFSTLFGDAGPESPLVLVGDPKQAIYSFRGANIHTYLAAIGAADIRSLSTNWRSDGAVLDALDALLDGATFGDADIRFAGVTAAGAHADQRIHEGDAPGAALRIRLAIGDDIVRNKNGDSQSDDAERAVLADMVAHIRRLLTDATIPDEADGAPSERHRSVRPDDVAVLVRSGKEAEAVQAALVAQGVPAVLARGGSVLESPAAEQWRWLLAALSRPSDVRRARTFALSWFGGRDVTWVANASEDELAGEQERLLRWADGLSRGGVGELLRQVTEESGVVPRVLARPDGDRALTDLDHVAELLRAAAPGGRASISGLLAALDRDPEVTLEAEREGDVASRRIETEARAVQVMTVWVAKGLEFPVVCCPTLWRLGASRQTIYQDDATGRRALDLAKGTGWPDKAGAKQRKERADREDDGEALRLLYVALTRARHQTSVWWARGQGSRRTALARALFARDEAGELDPVAFSAANVTCPDDDEAVAALQSLVTRADARATAAGRAGGLISVVAHGHPPRPLDRWIDPTRSPTPAALEVARLDRALDREARRWSFTAVTASGPDLAHHSPTVTGTVAPEPATGGADEGPEVPDELDPAAVAVDPTPTPEAHDLSAVVEAGSPTISPMASLPAGAGFGTLVHAVFEEVDFTAPDLDAQIATQIDAQLAWRDLDLSPVGVLDATPEVGRGLLVAGIRAAIDTPLGAALGGGRLADVAASDRLDEMSFELHLAGGGTPATDRAIGALILEHLDLTDAFRPWAAGLAEGAFDVRLAGHLTGSIDAVLRLPGPDGPRFVVVDYKTNRLHPAGTVPSADAYAPSALVPAMAEHHYPLQALLYAVALHRYLRWRLPGYDPARHLGGAAYLFVRGMSGPGVAHTAGEPHGVARWAIPPSLVTALSDLLDGRPAPGAGS